MLMAHFKWNFRPGEAYVEMTKGFERQAVRQKIEIQPGQRELTLEIPRFANLRAKGWVTADTHTHFLSPTTALLEAQAEGLNLINLLAAQWGDLFTNVGDLSHGPVISADRDSMVWVGTENRQHILGHIGLEGVQGKAVFPMSADGAGRGVLRRSGLDQHGGVGGRLPPAPGPGGGRTLPLSHR